MRPYLLVLTASSMFFSLVSIPVSRSSISFSNLAISSSRGPRYCPGGRSGEGSGSIGEGRNGSRGLLGSNLDPNLYVKRRLLRLTN